MMLLAPPTKAVRFNHRTGKYSEIGGNASTPARLRVLQDIEREALEKQLGRITERFLAGRITPAEFERALATELKPSLLRMTALAAGGHKQIRRSPYRNQYFGAVGNHLQRRYAGISNLSQKIVNGELTPNEIRRDVKRYALSVYAAFDRADMIRRIGEQGHTEGNRFLQPGKRHCPDCPGHVTNGFIDIELVVPRGHACICGGRCYCQIVTRKRGLSSLRPDGSLKAAVEASLRNQELQNDGPSLMDIERKLLSSKRRKKDTGRGFG